MLKVLLVATVQSHICQFHKPLVEILREKGAEIHVAARDNLSEKNGLKLDFVDKVFDIPFRRSPFDFKNLKAYRELKKIIKDGNYDVIHCNTPVGGILTRLAARRARKKGTKVFYTAHGFHFYKGAPIKNWLIWYPIEKFFAKKCDTLITINEEDYELAKRKFKTNVVRIHGVGVDDKKFAVATESERIEMRSKLGLDEKDFVILCIGELNENKNQTLLISAAAKLKDEIPNLKILFAGNGPKEKELKEQAEAEGLNGVVNFLGYRTDLPKIIPCVDLGVSCSKREGLPVNVIEFLFCKIPVVLSETRGHKELLSNENLFNPDDYKTLRRLIAERRNYGKGEHNISEPENITSYSSVNVREELKEIYSF